MANSEEQLVRDLLDAVCIKNLNYQSVDDLINHLQEVRKKYGNKYLNIIVVTDADINLGITQLDFYGQYYRRIT